MKRKSRFQRAGEWWSRLVSFRSSRSDVLLDDPTGILYEETSTETERTLADGPMFDTFDAPPSGGVSPVEMVVSTKEEGRYDDPPDESFGLFANINSSLRMGVREGGETGWQVAVYEDGAEEADDYRWVDLDARRARVLDDAKKDKELADRVALSGDEIPTEGSSSIDDELVRRAQKIADEHEAQNLEDEPLAPIDFIQENDVPAQDIQRDDEEGEIKQEIARLEREAEQLNVQKDAEEAVVVSLEAAASQEIEEKKEQSAKAKDEAAELLDRASELKDEAERLLDDIEHLDRSDYDDPDEFETAKEEMRELSEEKLQEAENLIEKAADVLAKIEEREEEAFESGAASEMEAIIDEAQAASYGIQAQVEQIRAIIDDLKSRLTEEKE